MPPVLTFIPWVLRFSHVGSRYFTNQGISLALVLFTHLIIKKNDSLVSFRSGTLVVRHDSKCRYPLNPLARPALYVLLWGFLYWHVIKLPKSCFDCIW